jgi:hypothetical protein
MITSLKLVGTHRPTLTQLFCDVVSFTDHSAGNVCAFWLLQAPAPDWENGTAVAKLLVRRRLGADSDPFSACTKRYIDVTVRGGSEPRREIPFNNVCYSAA